MKIKPSQKFPNLQYRNLQTGCYSVGNKARKLNKICSGNLYPFFLESIVEHILATTNEGRLGDKDSIFSQRFQDCIYWPFESTFVLNNNAILIIYLFYWHFVDISGSEMCCIQSNCYHKK